MSNRHKGTGKARPATMARPESPTATAGDLFVRLERSTQMRVILQTVMALMTRTARPDGKRSTVLTAVDQNTQCLAAKAYLLDGRSAAEVYEALEIAGSGVTRRAWDRYIEIVRHEYQNRLNAEIFKCETAADVLAIRGDVTALSAMMWSELAVKFIGFARASEIADLDNNTRHLFLRFSEGLTDMAKTSAEARRTEAQTEKLLRQLRQEVDDAGRKGHGKMTTLEVRQLIDRALGLEPRAADPREEVAA